MLFALLVSTAQAWVWTGSPVVYLVVDRPAHDLTSGSVYVSKVRMHACAGGYTDYAVNQSLDPTEPFSRAIGAGNWCGVQVYWGSSLTASKASGTVRYDEASTSLEIVDAEPISTALTPYTVVSGSWSGAAPRLYVEIE